MVTCMLFIFSCSKDNGLNPAPYPEDNATDTPDSPATQEDSESTEYYQYGLGRLVVNTYNSQAVASKDNYVGCNISLNGGGVFSDRQMRGRIRGRGNSTWFWYPKKPYRIKLDESSKMMGMKKNLDWVLLADFRDVTHLMNNVAFTLAHETGLPCANRSRYVRLVLNGKSHGLYMLTEQVEEGKHRVPLDPDTGILLALDMNDGPAENPGATDNFWSYVFGTACAVKYPEDPRPSQVASVRTEYSKLETAINNRNWTDIQKLLDIDSMISYILIQEIIGNGELNNGNSMRSGYIHRYSSTSKWVMGPFWDADAGFGYDASDMFNNNGMCHTFFAGYKWLVFGTDPYNHIGTMNGRLCSDLFCKLFGIIPFVKVLKAKWAADKDRLLSACLTQIDKTEAVIATAAANDMEIWSITKFNHAQEVAKLKEWLTNRFAYLDTVIPNYPE